MAPNNNNNNITVPAREGYDSSFLGVVSDFLHVRINFFFDFVESELGVRWFGNVDFVDTHDYLFHT